MIPVSKLTSANEPPLFDTKCRQPGAAFLRSYPDKDPHEKSEWWREFKPELGMHFHYRCGWTAMSIILDGDVDHYLACGHCRGKPSPHRDRAFDWSNYRYASGLVNSRKGNHNEKILDPCEVGNGWFEVLLPSFTLRGTDLIPEEYRNKARFTIKELKLFNDYHVRLTRWHWYQSYWNGGDPLIALLDEDAPLVAVAVRKAVELGEPLPDPTVCLPGHVIRERKRRYANRQERQATGTDDGNPSRP